MTKISLLMSLNLSVILSLNLNRFRIFFGATKTTFSSRSEKLLSTLFFQTFTILKKYKSYFQKAWFIFLKVWIMLKHDSVKFYSTFSNYVSYFLKFESYLSITENFSKVWTIFKSMILKNRNFILSKSIWKYWKC